MNIITIIKRENNLISKKNLMPSLCVVLVAIVLLVEMTFFSRMITNSLFIQRINYNMITKFNTYALYALFALSFIISPLLTVGVLSTDKSNGSLDIIITTKINRSNIIIGKALHRLFCLVIISIAVLPFIALTFIFGGFDIIRCLNIAVYYILTSLFVIMIGITISAFIEDEFFALLLNYFCSIIIALWLYMQKDLIHIIDKNNVPIFIVEIILILVCFMISKHSKVFNK